MAKESIPLDLNESYWLLDDETLSLIRDMPREAFSVYPAYNDLAADIATYAKVDAANVCVAPGSDEAIRATVRFCAKRNYKALLVLPTFSGYEKVLSEIPLDTKRLYYTEQNGSFEFPMQETLSCIEQHEVDVVFLCEPNNPLGTVLGQQPFESLMEAASEANVLIVSDEAYGEYGGSSAIGYIQQQPTIVLRTLSKAFGVPGIRLGYAISSEEIASELNTSLFGTLPWIIPGPSVHAARVVIARAHLLEARKKMVIKEREKFALALKDIPDMTIFPSFGNFLLARHPQAGKIAQTLSEAGIKVGEGENKTSDPTAKSILRSTLRMAVPAPKHQKAVLKAIHSAL